MQNLLTIGIIQNSISCFHPHQHPCWEIVYYTHGNGILTVGSREIPFQPGDIVCQPPGIPHSEFAEKGYRNIHFCIGTMETLGEPVPCFTDNETRQIYGLLMQLYTESHIKRKNWRNITEGLLNTAYQYMISFSSGSLKNPYVEKTENLLIANMCNPQLSLKKVLDEIPLSRDHARRLFIKETGKTPTQYLMEKRIGYAKQLLEIRMECNAVSIKEIASQAGFADPYYFSRAFRKATGKCPTQWTTGQGDRFVPFRHIV